jgi:rare lipoprotein A
VVDRGIASWYGPKFHGRRTANGERYNMHGLTAAHRTLPFGTWVEVTNLDNGRRVVVRINDRGPFVKGRVIDLSLGAARQLELVGPGTARVELRLLAAAGTSRYVVQVGAFTSRTRADLLAEDLWHRFQQVSVASDGAWHRVQVGPYGARGEAEEARRRLEDLGFTPLLLALPNEEPGGDFKGPARAASP